MANALRRVRTGLGTLREDAVLIGHLDYDGTENALMCGRMLHVTPGDLARLRCAVGEARDTDDPHVAHLREALDRAVKVWPDRLPTEIVGLDSLVRLRERSHSWAVSLVLPADADAERGLVSVLSPLGAAMFGRRVGERFVVREADGERELDVLGIIIRPEANSGARGFEGHST